MRFWMMTMAAMLVATTPGMAHGELENGKSWSVPNYYYHHFHIYLQSPAPVPVEQTQHLQVAEASGVAPTTKTQSSNTAAGILTPELVRQIENKLNEETSVCAPPSGTSEPLSNDPVVQEFVPATWILGTLERSYGIKWPKGMVIPTRLTQAPQHGELVIIDSRYNSVGDVKGSGPFTERYRYTPDLAYYKAHGIYHDTAKFEVDIDGYTFHLNYRIEVSPYPCGVGQAGNFNPEGISNIAGGPVIRVTLESVTSQAQEGAPTDAVLPQIDSLGQSLATSPLSSLLSSLGISSFVQVTTADLSSGALGQTTGSSITLDTNAAGYSWYIDYTPYLNDEYLPTSNPNLWIAKEGTEAAGKMDMLSVLLHEYGHALGLDHSTDSGDYMAATLQPGVRRLPSSDELALMARLVAEAKATYVATTDQTPLRSGPFKPQEPGIPTPNRGHHNVRTTRARISRYGTTILNADGSDPSQSQSPQDATQFAIVANPTLTDAKLQTGTGWESTGSVAIGNGAAVLSETTRSQTRLNQVFTVGPNDRYLTFTLANIGLDDVDNGPDDAFEVALLNANTGSVLTGATGLTRNDAFLNLQANGSEFLGDNVTSTRNADGSRTYRLDLSGIPAGTAVNLSFDLIGFDSAGSHVTVRDIRLGVPETRDDTATTLPEGGRWRCEAYRHG